MSCGCPASGGPEGVSVELEEVVGGGDESPFGAHGGSASSVEAAHSAVELRLAKDRLDHRLALAVELAAMLAGKDPAHERVVAAVPARPWALSSARVGRDQDLDAAIDDVLHLLVMPVAGVGEHDARRLGDTGRCEL